MMENQELSPSVNLLLEFKEMQMGILRDADGEKTRGLVGYFRKAEKLSLELRAKSDDFSTREFAMLVTEAAEAAALIVTEAWERAHGREFLQPRGESML